ncbi:DUF2537 domain-containing protein [Saccharothrix yanglingensis]|uniref:DUF2537 domain-containing protein n=1 Tax=Saccharothrix yanglingensis TaxID=659496 RepID=A0ABU0WXA4_9PSEU|nr:DUF2537 domain-containing protein [Saccharothrix yanglingensis]MDQ2584491.1 hypothetical protein [Saccharothrix yanglingensis]
MELRVQDGRAVLAGSDDAGEHEVDPHTLPLGAGLAEALHEWAKVADAVSRTDSPSEGVAGALVTRRGHQLAGRLAADMGSPVRYTDPVTGDVVTVDVPAAEDESRPDEPRSGETRPDGPDEAAAEAGQAPEPTPWGTGLTVSLITAAVVTFTVFTLSVGLGETSQWLALLANVLVVGGISPSVWLARRVPVWRWVAYGVVAGVLAAWLSLLLNGLL